MNQQARVLEIISRPEQVVVGRVVRRRHEAGEENDVFDDCVIEQLHYEDRERTVVERIDLARPRVTGFENGRANCGFERFSVSWRNLRDMYGLVRNLARDPVNHYTNFDYEKDPERALLERRKEGR